MSNWNKLNQRRVRAGYFSTDDSDGFNGAFMLEIDGKPIKVIASDGEGWQHVSVSQAGSSRTPTWETMCAVKELFWDDEDCVMQLHPARSQYVNNHPGCLHLWRPTSGSTIPLPPQIMVGLPELNLPKL